MQTPPAADLGNAVTVRTYPGTPDQVRQVRDDLRRILDRCPIADDVILCASELAANAMVHSNSRHPGRAITVRCEISQGDNVRIQVDDDGGPWNEPAPGPARGRGLDIVCALANEWAITTTPHGRAVSARLNWNSR